MMMKAPIFLLLCLVLLADTAIGAVSLVANLASAECEGHLENLSLTSATCDYDDYRCTYGSHVWVTGQVTTTADIPRPMKVHVVRTMPFFYSLGLGAYDTQIDNICKSGTLTPPEGDSAGYYCPEAGTYNFHFMYDLWGNSNGWYAAWSGFSMGLAVHLKYEGGGTDYGKCHLKYRLKRTDDDSLYTSVSFAGFALLGTGLLAGLAVRNKRKQRRAGTFILDEGRRGEISTGFELARDPVSV